MIAFRTLNLAAGQLFVALEMLLAKRAGKLEFAHAVVVGLIISQVRRRVKHRMRLGDGPVSYLSIHHIDATHERRLLMTGFT